MKISAAIFDMDGTITDSMCYWAKMCSMLVRSCGKEPADDLDKRMKGKSFEQIALIFDKEYGIRMPRHEVNDAMNAIMADIYETVVVPKPGVVDLLELFKARGVKMCVATMTDLPLAEKLLTRLNLRDYFSEIFTCQMVGAGKEKPTIYNVSLEHLGTKREETPVFEDALYAIRSAKTAGFPVVAIYEATFDDDQQKIRELADVYIEDYRRDSCKLF